MYNQPVRLLRVLFMKSVLSASAALMSPLLLLPAALVPAAAAPGPAKAAKRPRPTAAAQEEADRRMARGAAGVKNAAGAADLKEAAAEFEAAGAAVPTLTDAFYNAGVTYAKAGEHGGAARNLRRYLELSPRAADLKAVKAQLAEQEFLLEKTAKAATKLAGRWGSMYEGQVSLFFGKVAREWVIEAGTAGRYTMRMIAIGGSPVTTKQTFDIKLDGDAVTGTYTWDGRAPSGGEQLCESVTSLVTGELKDESKVLVLRYESRMKETGCGSTRNTEEFTRVP